MPELKHERYERFCQSVCLERLPQWKAYLEAGFNVKNASVKQASKYANRLSKRPEIQQRMAELAKVARDNSLIPAETRAREMALDRSLIMDGLREIYERCMDAIEVKDRHGVQTGVWRFDAKGALHALKMYGQELGMFRNVSEVWKGKLDPVEGLGKEDLEQMLLGLANECGFTLVRDPNTEVSEEERARPT